MELTEQVERIKEVVPRFAEVDGEGVPMEWKQQVERIKETVPCFTEEMICKMHEQCKIDSDPETPSNSGSPSSSAKSSVASQLQSVSLDRVKEVACRTEDDAAPTSRSNARASRAKGPQSSHASVAGSDPVALGNNVASSSRNYSGNNVSLGSSNFLEYKLFPPPTQQVQYSFPQYGKSFMLNVLVANANQPSELRRLLRSPSLDFSEPSRSSAAGSQHPQTSTSESGPSEATPTSTIQTSRDPQDPVLDAPFGVSSYGPIQRPGRMSENAQPFTASASIHRSLETLSLGNNMSACCGFTRPYIVPSFYQPLWPLQQHGYMDGGDNMHRNFGYDMPSAQQEVHQAGSLSRANADASVWGSYPGTGSTPPGSLTISPAPSDISRGGNDFALHAQAQHQQRKDYRPAEVNYSYSVWNHQPDSGAMSALPELQLGSFPRWGASAC
ncbi:uncharacterized protein LOC115685806 [Syzygium oleosum]|uniref:uncharacterized protein LOC115685806 n=1 Tax=Syzygium oleosum TaxID=219896 RepID=UPI0024B8E1BB|nr:uncharacterized protein LOC115685806 [Syzygium oleosum]